jgi:hypothetical protein
VGGKVGFVGGGGGLDWSLRVSSLSVSTWPKSMRLMWLLHVGAHHIERGVVGKGKLVVSPKRTCVGPGSLRANQQACTSTQAHFSKRSGGWTLALACAFSFHTPCIHALLQNHQKASIRTEADVTTAEKKNKHA